MRTVLVVLAVIATGASAAEPAPPPRAVRPVISFVSASKTPTGLVRITLRVENDGDTAVRYLGFRADSFTPPLRKGVIEPDWGVDAWRNGEWEPLAERAGCGFGIGFYDLPAKTAATFTIALPSEKWGEARMRVSIPFFIDDQTAAWRTVGITRQQIEKSVTEAAAPPLRKK